MKNWWRIPVTEGAEYDEYDYFYTELPQNSREWSTWDYKCSECGKWHKLNVVYTEYFYTLDGYDSLSTEVCWLCEMKNIIWKPFRKIKRNWKILKEMIDLKKDLPKKSWKKYYEFAKILQK
jgi:hypothetical protein